MGFLTSFKITTDFLKNFTACEFLNNYVDKTEVERLLRLTSWA